MKKLFISILAVAAAVACTKTNVDFEQPAEIGFAPVASMSSKAALNTATYPTDQPIGIWSNYAGDVNPATVSDYTKFSTKYLDNVKFINRTTVVEDKETATANWGGATPYYWPTNGSLVFAGYSIPKDGNTITTAEDGDAADAQTVSYDFTSDEMVFKNYEQSLNTANTFDLLWFGRTADSYNYRNASTAVPVKFNHALSWITIQVKGEGTAIAGGNAWAVESVKLLSVVKKGTATLTGTTASWALSTAVADKGDMAVFTIPDTGSDTSSDIKQAQKLTADAAVIEDVTGGTVVLPQTPVKLEVSYSYKTPAGSPITEKKEVELTLDAKNSDNNVWKPGYHYTYTLTFKSNEILVAPSVETWIDSPGNGTGHDVTVE